VTALLGIALAVIKLPDPARSRVVRRYAPPRELAAPGVRR
jgi:hypothetical protein